MTIELAAEQSIDSWMDWANNVKGSFPALETQQALENHRKTVLDFMDKGL